MKSIFIDSWNSLNPVPVNRIETQNFASLQYIIYYLSITRRKPMVLLVLSGDF